MTTFNDQTKKYLLLLARRAESVLNIEDKCQYRTFDSDK